MSLFNFRGKKAMPKPESDVVGFYSRPPAASVGWYWTPRVASSQDYPLDLDASERYLVPKTGIDVFMPMPIQQLRFDQAYQPMGWMNPLYGTDFVTTWEHAFAKTPFGPLPSEALAPPSPFNYTDSYTTAAFYQNPKEL